MKTREMGYPKAWADAGGYPEEYPLDRPFPEHIRYVAGLLKEIRRLPDSDEVFPVECEFVARMRRYYRLGFDHFADACCRKYNEARNRRIMM